MPKAGGIAPRKKRTNIFKQLASAGLIPSTILNRAERRNEN
jgi:hypothetical protein